MINKEKYENGKTKHWLKRVLCCQKVGGLTTGLLQHEHELQHNNIAHAHLSTSHTNQPTNKQTNEQTTVGSCNVDDGDDDVQLCL